LACVFDEIAFFHDNQHAQSDEANPQRGDAVRGADPGADCWYLEPLQTGRGAAPKVPRLLRPEPR
jgi:hypothetical protein